MKISVIIAAFNVEKVLQRALDSVVAQSFPAHEIIVVDDCSTDDTPGIAERYSEQHANVSLLRLATNGGPSVARNAAFSASTGDWVAILDADDAWRPDRLEVLARLATESDADLVMDNQRFYDAVAQREASIAFSASWHSRQLFALEFFQNGIGDKVGFPYANFKPVFSRAFLNKYQLRYDIVHRYGEDFLLLAECLLNGAKAMISAEPMYIYTTRLGEFSKAVSPFSHSTPRFDLLVKQSDEIEKKYGPQIGQPIQQAIHARRSTLILLHLTNIARNYRRQKQYARYVLCLLQHPALMQLLSIRIARRVWDRILPARA